VEGQCHIEGERKASWSTSINTLKSHARAIYQKLGVSARHSAIEEARLRNLL